jgi:predicted HTH domain antitoxin
MCQADQEGHWRASRGAWKRQTWGAGMWVGVACDKSVQRLGITASQRVGPSTYASLDGLDQTGEIWRMSITLEFDDAVLASLPLGPGERERHMQIELACRYYAQGWLSLAQAARLAGLDHYAFGVELGERGIPRQYGLTEAQEDIAHARRQ